MHLPCQEGQEEANKEPQDDADDDRHRDSPADGRIAQDLPRVCRGRNVAGAAPGTCVRVGAVRGRGAGGG